MGIIFAPFGNTEYFFEKGYKSTFQMPRFLNEIGLNGYEYSLEEGIHISDDGCEILKDEAKKHNISLSLYSGKQFCDLDSAVELAEKIGAERVVVPLGNCAITSRKAVYENTLLKMKNSLEKSDKAYICPETMGLIHDLGTLQEVLKLTKENERFIPALNFPNLFARSLGKKIDYDDALNIFKMTENMIGKERTNKLHIYLSNVYYTNQGYKKYADFSENTENDFSCKPILNAVKKLGLSLFIVCRSPYDCYNDAVNLKKQYEKGERKNESIIFKRT